MDKRYQVFVSSTFEDLQEERKEVMQALLELDCIPAGMELFPASNEDQWTLIKRVIDDSDYYLLIIGGRYGSTNEQGISYTQMEFEYALETGKPIISFLIKDPTSLPVSKSEQEQEKKEKLEKFKELAKKRIIRTWNNSTELGSMVSRSMIKLIKNFPAEGWIKSNSAVDENSIKEIARLQKENAELKQQIKTITTQAPKGTEKLAQGEDKIIISFRYSIIDITADNINYSEQIEFSWNEIFITLAPNMLMDCPEQKLINIINNEIEKIFMQSKNSSTLTEFYDFQIEPKDFSTIKIQLKALGLISLCNNNHKKTENIYWKLTPYGEHLLTQLIAIKR